MASETIEALFTAQETVSNALNKIDESAGDVSESMGYLSLVIDEAEKSSETADDAFDDMRIALAQLDKVSDSSERAMEELNSALLKAATGSEVTNEELESVNTALAEVASSTAATDQAQAELVKEFRNVALSGEAATQSLDLVQRNMVETAVTAQTLVGANEEVVQSMVESALAANEADRSVESYNDALGSLVTGSAAATAATESAKRAFNAMEHSGERASEAVDDVRNSAYGAAAGLTTLNTVISDTILNFGSLSVNIGPFNVALRNFVTQVPAILTGMGSMISMITALIAGFGTLALVSGGLLAGGAFAFFEEFSSQFEESSEAIEAMMAALRNLFIDAIEPLMTDANMDLFVETLNNAARFVNRFAQFINQMRDDVLRVFDEVEGSPDKFFNSLHDTFVTLRPVIIAFINFFLQKFPEIVERFGELTSALSGDVGVLLRSLGALLDQLLQLSTTILAGVAPAVKVLVGALTIGAKILNTLHSNTLSAAITFGILGIAVLKVISAFTGLIASAISLNGWLIANAATGGFLGGVYGRLVYAAASYAGTSMSLSAVLKELTAQLYVHIAASLKDLATKIKQNLAVRALSEAYAGLTTWIMNSTVATKISSAWSYIAASAKLAYAAAVETAALSSVKAQIAIIGLAGVMAIYTVLTTLASAATWSLNAALAVLTSPITVAIALFAGLITVVTVVLDLLLGTDFTGGIIDFLAGIVNWIGNVIDSIMKLLGLTGKKGPDSGTPDPDDIQTQAAVDLSFEDKVEQQVDVQADPEDKEGLRRIVKDAMNEANSLARRQEGLGR